MTSSNGNISALLDLCFVREIHWSPVNSPHKGQWRGALMFSLICALLNGWVNNRDAFDLRRYSAHYDVIVMLFVVSLGVGHRNGKLTRMTALAVTGYVEGKLQRPWWRPGQSPWRPFRFCVDVIITVTSLRHKLFRRRSKKTSKLRVTGLCAGNSPGTVEFPA